MDALLPLERFAALSAEIESGSPRDAVLDREGLSPEQWTAFEAMWRARIEDDISHGSFELTNRYNAAFVARREELRYESPPEPAAAVGYAAEAMGQPTPTPRMMQAPVPTPRMMQAPEPYATMGEAQLPPPTPRMMQAPEPPAMMGDPAHQGPPPTPRMRQAPEPPMASPAERERMTKTQPMQVVSAARVAQAPEVPARRSAPPPLPRARPSRPEMEMVAPELGDRITPVPDTLRPGMGAPVGHAGDRLTPPPSTQEDRPGSFDEASPPSSRPPSTPRQDALEGPRLDGLPFRPAFAASDAAPRSTNDLSGVLPFKPAVSSPAVSSPVASPPAMSAPAMSPPAMSAPAMSPPAASPPQSPWSAPGTGTVKMTAPYASAPPTGHPSEPEIEAPAPISTHAMPAGFGEVHEIGPPVLTGPGSLTPAPIVFPFALWRRTAEPQAYAAPVYAPQPQFAPAPVAQPHPAQAHAPQAPFPLALPAAGPVNAPLLPPANPPILTAPASTHLAPPSARQTLPPNLAGASPVTPFKVSPETPAVPVGFPAQSAPQPAAQPVYPQGPANLAQTGFTQQQAYAAPPANAPGAPYPASPPVAAVPPAQPSQPLAVPAVLGASTSRLTLEQYASLSAEIAISPGTSAAVRARYGLDENTHVAETGLWQRRFSADKDLFTRYSALYQSYREWFSRSAR